MLILIRRKTLWTMLVILLLGLLLWQAGRVLMPFLLGTAIAYLLDPVAGRLQRMGLSRAAATAIIAIGVLVAMLLAALMLLPALIVQLTQLANALPGLVRNSIAWANEHFPQMMEQGGFLNSTLTELSEKFRTEVLRLLGGTLRSVVNVISAAFIAVLTPAVAIYLLYDWEHLIAGVDRRLPRRHAPLIRSLAHDIDRVLSGFVRGQLIVGLLLASFYGVALGLVGLQYALVIGVLAGLLNFIPYLGSFSAFVISMAVALMQFWGDGWQILIVAVVFIFGQVVEINFVTPRIVGDSVKLHPVWLLVSLAVFGSLFGFTGLLVAVPVSASLGVVIRWLDHRWLASNTYHQDAALPEADRLP